MSPRPASLPNNTVCDSDRAFVEVLPAFPHPVLTEQLSGHPSAAAAGMPTSQRGEQSLRDAKCVHQVSQQVARSHQSPGLGL